MTEETIPQTEVKIEQPLGPKVALKDISIDEIGAGGGVLMPKNFAEAIAFAQIMCKAGPAIPRHLRENPGACMAIILQSLRWGMDPFAVASKTYFVPRKSKNSRNRRDDDEEEDFDLGSDDRMAFEAQLVAAVVLTRAPIKSRPVYAYSGAGIERQCKVSVTMLDGSVKDYETPPLRQIKKKSPLWVDDPDQQLGYYAIRAWARRHTPEVLLGVYTPDEMEDYRGSDTDRDAPPTRLSLAEKLAAKKPNAGGFDHGFVMNETAGALPALTHQPQQEFNVDSIKEPVPAETATAQDSDAPSPPSGASEAPAGATASRGGPAGIAELEPSADMMMAFLALND